MKVTKHENEDGSYTLKATASPAEVGHAFNAAAGAFAMQMGLRVDPGASALDQVKERLNVPDPESIVRQQALEALVPHAVDKSGLVPAYVPRPKVDGQLVNGKEFSFEVTVTPKPEYELESYEPVSITMPPLKFPEEELDKAIEQLAESYARYITDLNDHPIAEGEGALIALKASMDGKVLEGLSTEGRTYVLGLGMLPADFDRQLIGMKPGDTKTFTISIPTSPSEASMMTCEVTVKANQKKVVDEIDDEWVSKNMPFYSSAEDLRNGMRERMEADVDSQYEQLKVGRATEELIKRFKGSIPDPIYEATRETLIGNLNAELQQQGMTLDQFVAQQGGQEAFGMSTMMQVRQILVQGFVLDAVFRHEKLELTDADIDLTCASMDPQDPKGLRRRMEQNGFGYSLREAAERNKAGRWLAEHAQVEIDENMPLRFSMVPGM